jgi:hypothetical protein
MSKAVALPLGVLVGAAVLAGVAGAANNNGVTGATVPGCTAAAQTAITKVVGRHHDNLPEVFADLNAIGTPEGCVGLSQADQQRAVLNTPFAEKLQKTVGDLQNQQGD